MSKTVKKKLIQKKLYEDKPVVISHNKKILYLLIAIIIIIALIGAVILINYNGKNLITNNVNEEITTTEENITSPHLINNTINASSTLEDFYATGKPSLIVFAGTYCGHCKTLIPELETEIWSNYSTKANIWINVTDGKDGKRFPVSNIAQGYNSNLDYDEIIGDCDYVPAYVVLDKTGKEILRSCGSTATSIQKIKQALDSQLN